VLPVVAFTKLDAGDLGDGVGLVGRLQGASQQVLFPDRLRAVARVDATRSEEAKALDAGLMGAVDEVRLDHQVLVDEIGTQAVVGVDAAHLGRRHEYEVRLFLLKEG
jgi:hypothetical protein